MAHSVREANEMTDFACSVLADLYFLAAVVSGVLFVIHKLEGRFRDWGRPDPDRHPDWHGRLPGLIITHLPFGSVRAAAIASTVYFLIAGSVLLAVRTAAAATVSSTATDWDRTCAAFCIALFSSLWMAWNVFEMHHLRNAIRNRVANRGLIFSCLGALWIFFVYLPVTLALLLWTVGA